MRVARGLVVVMTVCVSLLHAPGARGQQTPQERIRRAFSLVGQWTITKLEVSKVAFQSTNPGAAGAAVATVSIDIGSSLGEGSFEVRQDGTITGQGIALYHYRVSGGSAAAGIGPDQFLGVGIAVPIGASAMLAADDDGKRGFSINGQADLSNRTISLKAFQPIGKRLKIVIQPGLGPGDVALWPPMTNVSPTHVVVEGASLLLRAAGVVGGIPVSIEAVKYVDLEGLLESIISSCGCSHPQSGASMRDSVFSEFLLATLSHTEKNLGQAAKERATPCE